jgi:flagellar hook protein FlgE
MSFRIALSGLNAATTGLNVISNNIANSNTTGFKYSQAQFADVFASGALDFRSDQVGNGVRLASIAQQFAQGNVEFTGNNLDLAITGQGFFTLRDPSGGYVYTRNGSFSVDRDGYVVNSQNQRMQVYPPVAGTGGFNTGVVDDLLLQTSQSSPNPTTTGNVVLNLPANATPPTIAFDPTNPATYNQTTSTAVYDSLGNQYTMTFYFVKNAAPGTWDVNVAVDGTMIAPTAVPAVATPQLIFDQSGVVVTPANGQLTFPAFTAAIPASVNATANATTFDFAKATQYGDTFGVSAITQDGYTTGRLTTIDVGNTGVVSARFTNGRALQLGQLALSSFPNPQGLRQLGNTTWAETFNSGPVIRGQPGTASFGLLQAGAVETSNVDLTKELVALITAQRAFQANAQSITTIDQTTQTILNIR